jgi:AcrR family transcriptional regulator
MGRIPAARHEQFAQARRDAILNAALKVFAQTGFAEAKMDQVAAAADLSKAALYLYFPSKDSLLQSLLERYALLPELPAMVAAIAKSPPAIGIPTLIAEIWRLLRERKELASVMVREIQSNPDRAKLFAERVGLPDSQCLADYLDRWIKRGVLKQQHSLAAAQCLFGMLWFFSCNPGIGRRKGSLSLVGRDRRHHRVADISQRGRESGQAFSPLTVGSQRPPSRIINFVVIRIHR